MKNNKVTVNVINTLHDGYRRAGLVLKQGENFLSVTSSEYQQLSLDKRLVVAITDDEPSANDSDFTDKQYQPTREELLLGACLSSDLEPNKYFTKKNTPRLDTWREIVAPDIKVEEIIAGLDVGGVE